MKYLLDTCVVSELIRKQADAQVVRWIQDCDEDCTYLSVLTIGEIQKGIAKLADIKRKAAIQRWLDADLRNRFESRILPITQEVALAWGLLQGEAEARGNPIPTIDGLIGATAITYNLTVVTQNEADIVQTGARVLNPWNL